MIQLRHLLTGSLALFGSAAASAVLDLTPSNFDSVVLKSGKPALVEFFAPWCGHCKTLAPIYEELASSFSSQSSKVTIGKVDADEHKSLGRQFGVQGFPTLKWFDGVSETPEDYKSGRDIASLTAFVSEKLGVKPKAKKAAPSHVEMLNDVSFEKEIGGAKDVLVAFTAPWCGHCKTLAPIWETVATDFATEPNVLIAKIDAEAPNAKRTADSQGVKSYPTIKFFPAGSREAVAYEGGRTEAALLAYINEKAGTHRVAGGGLDAVAGTVASLDAIVAAFIGGDVSASEKIAGAAAGLKDKYAEYYVKVFGKVALNKGYVEKESGRLAGLLKKGGLAPEKVDDLISRSNILRKFASVVGGKEEL